MSRLLPIALLLLGMASTALAVAPPVVLDTAPGDRILADYFRRQAEQLGNKALAGIRTRNDWEKQRPELRRQFLDMLGLWPLPPRTDLKAVVTGTVEAPTFSVERLHFQSRPGLYVTANLYLPKKGTGPFPAVLYVCGHGAKVIDGIPYGNKLTYQHHGAWFAENGYLCLIVDTLQLGEVPGLHHGTFRFGMWWWQARGYTPAGVETWNGIRALDYLISRKEVDPKRIGLTGRSGGGATSWWIAAADERVGCIVPVAGIADLQAHVAEGSPGRLRDGVIAGHCDCMYFVNTYQWDFSSVMALCAPRPLLLGNSDSDDIFPVPGYRRLADRVRKIYDLYGASDRFALLETTGPHKDTPELRQGAFRWMNRWFKEDNGPVNDPPRPPLDPRMLKVFDRLPGDSINDTVHETFVRAARPELPLVPAVAREWWKGQSEEWRNELLTRCFRAWPEPPPPLNAKPAEDISHDGVRLRAFDFTSEEGIDLRLWLLTHARIERPGEVIVSVADEAGWREWVSDLGPAFRPALYGKGNPAPRPYPAQDEARFRQHRRVMESYRWAFALIAPRGIGPTRWSEVSAWDGRPVGQHILRRFALLGATLDGQRVWDVRRGLACLRTVEALKGVPVTLQGRGVMAGIALYAAVFEPDVAKLDLWHPPGAHQEGPTFLNILRVLDMPQALALAFPRKINLKIKGDEEAKVWDWALRLQESLGQKYVQVRLVE
jgi:dienelactone hydrolase